MKIKHASILSATAVALLLLSGAVQAGDHDGHGGLCSNATLKGAFEFIGHGVILGLKTADGVLHPYATQPILDDVALVTFDGAGTFQRTDFGMIGGLPKGGKTTFNPKQEGTYTVIAADGTLVESVVYRAVTVAGESLDHTMCPPNCEQGVQEYFEGKKILVYGFR